MISNDFLPPCGEYYTLQDMELKNLLVKMKLFSKEHRQEVVLKLY